MFQAFALPDTAHDSAPLTRAHSTPDPDLPPGTPPPGPLPDDVPPPVNAPVEEPPMPVPPIKAAP